MSESPAIDRSPGSAEWRILLECARPKRQRSRFTELLRGPLDWGRLLALANAHGMIPSVAERLQSIDEVGTPAKIREALRDQHRMQAALALGLAEWRTAAIFSCLGTGYSKAGRSLVQRT